MQCGATPSGTEVPRCTVDPGLQARMAAYTPANAAVAPRTADIKWRFFWPLLSRERRAAGAAPDVERVMPQGFSRWRETLDGWGGGLLDTVETVATLLAVAYGLEADAFSRLLTRGHHLLAPTGAHDACVPLLCCWQGTFVLQTLSVFRFGVLQGPLQSARKCGMLGYHGNGCRTAVQCASSQQHREPQCMSSSALCKPAAI